MVDDYGVNVVAGAPLVFVAVPTLVLLMGAVFAKAVPNRLLYLVTFCIFGCLLSLPQSGLDGGRAFSGLVYADSFTMIFNIIILAGTVFTLLLQHQTTQGQRMSSSFDVDVLIIMTACGGMVMVSAANLMVLFVGFELLSIAVYSLAGTARLEKASSESAMKYFILGAFGSAFLLYGMTLVYGATGTMELASIAKAAVGKGALPSAGSSPMFLLGLGLILFGFGFKLSLVPFHFWSPDVYQGAPLGITTFMATVVKASAFGSFLRLMASAFGHSGDTWVPLLWALCAVTMTVGNLCALRQTSIKRMLAYSSIAHAGYALIGIVALGAEASGGTAQVSAGASTIFYLMVYSLMTVASFGVVLVVTAGGEQQYDRDSFSFLKGLGWERPFLGMVMTIAMLSLGGIPPLGGFFGKFYLIVAAVKSGFTGLAIIAVLNSLISLYYYLRVIVLMYFSEDEHSAAYTAAHGNREQYREKFAGPQVALIFATVFTIVLGVFANSFFDFATLAMKSVFA